jgi:hypothetical protein
LCKYPEDHLPYLTLLSDVGRNMRYMFGHHIHLGTRELDTNDIYPFVIFFQFLVF